MDLSIGENSLAFLCALCYDFGQGTITEGHIMRTLIIALSFIMLLAGAAFAKDPYVRGSIKRDGAYADPYYKTIPNQTRNDSKSTQGKGNPPDKQEKKGPDPYDNRYSNQYHRPRY